MKKLITAGFAALLALVGPASADTPRSLSYLQNMFRDGQPAGSITPLSMRDFVASVMGPAHSISGLNNVVDYACGINIADGATHTVGTAPAGSCFNGVTTLAGLAAITINGTQPFWFLTDSGTTTGPMCTYGTTTNCFLSGAAYGGGLTNASVANMDIGWLAIQAALLTRKTYIPAGNYLIGTSESLPLMVPITIDNRYGPGNIVQGDGPLLSVIRTNNSFGNLATEGIGKINAFLLGCGDPSATPTNTLGRWSGGGNAMCVGNILQLGLVGVQASTNTPTSTWYTDGLGIGARLSTTDVEASFFYNDITINGDHTLHIRLHGNEGVNSAYWLPPNSVLVGDLQFIDFSPAGGANSGILVDGNTSLAGNFDGETYINSRRYAIDGDNNSCAAPIIGGAFIKYLMTESIGLAVVNDEHVYNAGIYTDGNKCRGVTDVAIHGWFAQFSNANELPGEARRRRAAFDVSSLTGQVLDITTNGATPVPTADAIGAAGVAVFNVNGLGDNTSGIGIKLSGAILNVLSAGVGAGASGATIPMFPSNASGGPYGMGGVGAEWENPGAGGGIFANLATAGNYTTTHVGDLMEYQPGSYLSAQPAGASATAPIMGVVVQDGLANSAMMPLQQTGMQKIAAGYHYGNNGFEKKSTGIGGRTTFVAGSGGANGSYTITATGGGCTAEPSFTVTVAGGSITGVTSPNSTAPTGCTSAPTVPLTSISGLTGASVTPQWPAAGETTATSSQDGVIVGYGSNVNDGTPANGTNESYSRLLGMR